MYLYSCTILRTTGRRTRASITRPRSAHEHALAVNVHLSNTRGRGRVGEGVGTALWGTSLHSVQCSQALAQKNSLPAYLPSRCFFSISCSSSPAFGQLRSARWHQASGVDNSPPPPPSSSPHLSVLCCHLFVAMSPPTAVRVPCDRTNDAGWQTFSLMMHALSAQVP